MTVDAAKTVSYNDLRTAYREYLLSCDLSKNTVQTAYNDSFYLWNKSGEDTFWAAIESPEFEQIGKEALLDALRKNTTGDPQKLVNGYMSHLRRFRKFLSLSYKPSPSKLPPVSVVKVNKSAVRIPVPCPEQVEYYLKQWDALENYHLQEDALDKLFFELCPNNDSISDILLKVATLNDFYSTNIFSVYPVAKHILELDIDERLNSSDVSLVDDIKKIDINGKNKNFYSFATKFCSHHKPLDFPIYDSYVEKVLLHFRKQDAFAQFAPDDLKNYTKFKSIIIEFSRFYGLDKYNLKEVDKYIWQLGKEYFPKNYGKKKKKQEG